MKFFENLEQKQAFFFEKLPRRVRHTLYATTLASANFLLGAIPSYMQYRKTEENEAAYIGTSVFEFFKLGIISAVPMTMMMIALNDERHKLSGRKIASLMMSVAALFVLIYSELMMYRKLDDEFPENFAQLFYGVPLALTLNQNILMTMPVAGVNIEQTARVNVINFIQNIICCALLGVTYGTLYEEKDLQNTVRYFSALGAMGYPVAHGLLYGAWNIDRVIKAGMTKVLSDEQTESTHDGAQAVASGQVLHQFDLSKDLEKQASEPKVEPKLVGKRASIA